MLFQTFGSHVASAAVPLLRLVAFIMMFRRTGREGTRVSHFGPAAAHCLFLGRGHPLQTGPQFVPLGVVTAPHSHVVFDEGFHLGPLFGGEARHGLVVALFLQLPMVSVAPIDNGGSFIGRELGPLLPLCFVSFPLLGSQRTGTSSNFFGGLGPLGGRGAKAFSPRRMAFTASCCSRDNCCKRARSFSLCSSCMLRSSLSAFT